MEKPVKEMHAFLSPGSGLPTPLNPEYSGIGKGQRIPDRCKTAHRKPPVKCFLTLSQVSQIEKDKYMISLTCGIEKKNGLNELIYKSEINSQTWKPNLG